MALRLTPLGDALGVAAEGIDLNQHFDDKTAAALREALLDRLVLCIRGQDLAPPAYRDAMRFFGKPLIRRQVTQHPDIEEINILSPAERDVLGDGKRLVNGAWWHTDDSFMAVPCSLTMLYGVEVPSVGGDTQFTNMVRAYDDLPDETKRQIDRLKVLHVFKSSRSPRKKVELTEEERKRTAETVQPLVLVHPRNRRKALYLNTAHMERILGMDDEEAFALINQLMAHVTQAKYEYRHKWRKGDIVIWDNRCSYHRAAGDYPPEEDRIHWRVSIGESALQ
jgi:taurine dioxygenase